MSTNHNTDLKILYWNAHSIQSTILETFDYLTENHIDIAIFQETYLKPKHSFSHENYKN